MKPDSQFKIFNKKDWIFELNQTYKGYCSINEAFHYLSKKFLKDFEKDLQPSLIGMTKALEVSRKQMVISFCTYIEIIIKDFFFTIFQQYPEKMEYFLPKEFRGEFLNLCRDENISKETLLIFSNIATKKMFSFNINETFNKICKLSEIEEISKNQCRENFIKEKNDLEKIFNLRNKLVHENKKEITKEPYNEEGVISYIYEELAPNLVEKLDILLCENLSIVLVLETKKIEEDTFNRLLKELL